MDKVNVLYCFDSSLWRAVAVSIESLLTNAKPTTQVTIYCMVPPKTEGRKKINKIIKSHKKGAALVWREVKPAENPFNTPDYAMWHPLVFYRCIAHRFFTDIDKLLYLNPYTLIYQDLAELFNTDISNYPLGAVYDMAPVTVQGSSLGALIRDFSIKYLKGGPYYNSGVLLLNLKKMAEAEHTLLEIRIPLRYPEQDLLNAAFVGKIRTLPLKYNLAPGIPIPPHFTKEEAEEINSGKHVIVDCYYTKPYDREHVHKLVYETFAKYAKNIGMTPATFVKEEVKQAPVKKTFIRHISTRQNKILFFGMEV